MTGHVRIYCCQRCAQDGTVCECTTEGDVPPTKCCMQEIPSWKPAQEGWR